ncbi:MAG TPA: prepilin-type N-terminal cleavage/methylation domain-containing protein [Candidatus Saccharimonadales bacterium]|jgi:prepilin-type N-terminal cleavage/methylation domain-containing protein
MKKRQRRSIDGFTVPELIVTIVIFAIISSSVYLLLMAHIGASMTVALRTSALSLASEQVEYLRSLPYDSLAVQGGTIVSSGTLLPASTDQTRADRKFSVQTDIRYADDAFDGCLSYPSEQAYLCRNGPPKSGLPVDNNPRDYKVADVRVYDKTSGKQYASLSSQFTSRVAETAGNSSALLVTVLDGSGSPVDGASVRVRNSTTTPTIDQTTTTDNVGVAVFIDVMPDDGPDYRIEATKAGYTTLSTIASSGSLTPTYPDVNAIAQQVSNVTLRIDQTSTQSLEIKMVDTSGSPVASVPFKLKGGIKLYTEPTDTSYSYEQTITPDASGTAVLSGLTPGRYQVCYLAQPNPCATSHTRQLSVIRVAYGSQSFQPFEIPAGMSSVVDGGPMQRIMLGVSTSGGVPRIESISPVSVSAGASDADDSQVTITGANLGGATVSLRRGATVVTGTVIGTDTSGSIVRQFNLSGAQTGAYELVVAKGGDTIVQSGVAPGELGGINVQP